MVTGLVACTAPMGDDAPSSLGTFAGPQDQADHGNRLIRMGDDAMRSGDFAAAAAIYERAAAARPGDGVPLERLGDAFLRMDDPQKALEAYRAALRIDPREPRASRGYGLALMRLGRPDAALAQLEPILDANPGDTRLWNAAGVAYDMTGRQADAQRTYRSILERSPGDVAAANNLALSLLLSGRSAEAIDLLRPLAEDARGSGRSRQNLALAYGIGGDFTAARRLLSLDLGDRDVEANIALMRTLQGGDPAASARLLLNAPQASTDPSVFESMETGSIGSPRGLAADDLARPDVRKQAVHHIRTNPREPVQTSSSPQTAQGRTLDEPAQPARVALQDADVNLPAAAAGTPMAVADVSEADQRGQSSPAMAQQEANASSTSVAEGQGSATSGKAHASQGTSQSEAERDGVEASEPASVTRDAMAEVGVASGAGADGVQAEAAIPVTREPQPLVDRDGMAERAIVTDGAPTALTGPGLPVLASPVMPVPGRADEVATKKAVTRSEPSPPLSTPVGDVEPGGAVSRVGVVAIADTEMAVGNIPVGDWLVDLGSFPTDRMAGQAWRQLRRSNPVLLGSANRMGGVGDGRTPLLVGPFRNEAAARETCSGIIGAAECTPIKM